MGILRGASGGDVGKCAELGCYSPHSMWKPLTSRELLPLISLHATVL